MFISLLTDFGAQDEYVGVMKGVILSAAPAVQIIDICHRIEPQNVYQAAFMIEAAFRHFPSGTLHVLVVDPGVGGRRRILYAESGDYRFLSPDNGLLTRIAQTTGLTRIRQVHNRTLFSPVVSRTFHGRDILAPVAAFLIQGGDPVQLGDAIPLSGIKRLEGCRPRFNADGQIMGRIVSIDRFGNLITNIGTNLLETLLNDNPDQLFQIDIGRQLTTRLHDAYEETSPGAALAIVGSRRTLEIAVNQGRASERFPAQIGAAVAVQPATRAGDNF